EQRSLTELAKLKESSTDANKEALYKAAVDQVRKNTEKYKKLKDYLVSRAADGNPISKYDVISAVTKETFKTVSADAKKMESLKTKAAAAGHADKVKYDIALDGIKSAGTLYFDAEIADFDKKMDTYSKALDARNASKGKSDAADKQKALDTAITQLRGAFANLKAIEGGAANVVDASRSPSYRIQVRKDAEFSVYNLDAAEKAVASSDPNDPEKKSGNEQWRMGAEAFSKMNIVRIQAATLYNELQSKGLLANVAEGQKFWLEGEKLKSTDYLAAAKQYEQAVTKFREIVKENDDAAAEKASKDLNAFILALDPDYKDLVLEAIKVTRDAGVKAYNEKDYTTAETKFKEALSAGQEALKLESMSYEKTEKDVESAKALMETAKNAFFTANIPENDRKHIATQIFNLGEVGNDNDLKFIRYREMARIYNGAVAASAAFDKAKKAYEAKGGNRDETAAAIWKDADWRYIHGDFAAAQKKYLEAAAIYENYKVDPNAGNKSLRLDEGTGKLIEGTKQDSDNYARQAQDLSDASDIKYLTNAHFIDAQQASGSGWYAHSIDQYKEIIHMCNAAKKARDAKPTIPLTGDSPKYLKNKGDAYYGVGNFESARKYYKMAMEIEKSYDTGASDSADQVATFNPSEPMVSGPNAPQVTVNDPDAG
ncbi:hypothetical protein IT411_00755, partial [Candidatus Peregrinibacteria bacterium]|nr:hypothetical protein [Candidatus Peregrinibacteria bacterium]